MKHIVNSQKNGMSLIELLITILIGTTISFMVTGVLINSTRVNLLSENLAAPQDNGRYLMSIMSQFLHKAGQDGIELDENGKQVLIPVSVFEACNAPSDHCIVENSGGVNAGAFNDSDRLSIAFTPDYDNPTDCTGPLSNLEEVTIHPQTQVTIPPLKFGRKIYKSVINTFWVEANNNIIPGETVMTFNCQSFKTSGGNWQAINPEPTILAFNVEAFHVLYGENTLAPEDGDGNKIALHTEEADKVLDQRMVNRYVPANKVLKWNNVQAVKVAFLIRSEQTVLDEQKRKYTLLDSATYQFEDQYLRQIYSTTIALNNLPPTSLIK